MVFFIKRNYRYFVIAIVLLLIGGVIVFINFPKHIQDRFSNNNSLDINTEYEIEYSEPLKEYYCIDGYTLSGKQCYSIILKVPALVEYSCEKGLVAYNQCDLSGLREFEPTVYRGSNENISDFKYNCNMSGGVYKTIDSGLKCEKWVSETVPAEANYYCIDGYKLSDKECLLYNYIDALYVLSCEDGYLLKDNNCIKNDDK